jgi:hypothetical membrane protein
MILLFLSVAAALSLSPWFNFGKDALSDLGVSGGLAEAAFNYGLMASGIVLFGYSASSLRMQARKASYAMCSAGIFLSLVGAVSLRYPGPHFAVAAGLFLSLILASGLYYREKGGRIALLGIIGCASWVLYVLGITGAAVPEIVTGVAMLPWIGLSSRGVLLYGKSK